MTKKMVIMLIIVGVILGGIFGYMGFKSYMMKKYMSAGGAPAVTVSAAPAVMEEWQPQISAVGTLRALRGVDVANEIAGLVQSVNFKSGDNVKAGHLLVQLNADTDIAQLRTLTAARDLSKTVYERNKKQFLVQAVSRASLEADAADLKVKQAQVAQQEAQVIKKTIRAPFAGRLGISTVNPGQYLNAGEKIVTLQALYSIYIDFYLPQQELSRIAVGQAVVAGTDTYPNKKFNGRISAVSPKVDLQTRNVQIEAVLANSRHELLPGMYATIKVQSGKPQHYLTIPRTAVTFNPYGETVYVVEEKGQGQAGKPSLAVRQTFVTLGPTRGDQVAILKGIKERERVVTSGQLKLRHGSPVVINNAAPPLNDPHPAPRDP
ncbi:MAG: efflux RND transporter periplasmic adaptor subunit [Smithellaceae bacterium]